MICEKCPDQLSLPFALWTRGVIRELIRREFDIRLSIREVGEYVTWWGYIPQKAARRVRARRCGGKVRIPAIVNSKSTRW